MTVSTGEQDRIVLLSKQDESGLLGGKLKHPSEGVHIGGVSRQLLALVLDLLRFLESLVALGVGRAHALAECLLQLDDSGAMIRAGQLALGACLLNHELALVAGCAGLGLDVGGQRADVLALVSGHALSSLLEQLLKAIHALGQLVALGHEQRAAEN